MQLHPIQYFAKGDAASLNQYLTFLSAQVCTVSCTRCFEETAVS